MKLMFWGKNSRDKKIEEDKKEIKKLQKQLSIILSEILKKLNKTYENLQRYNPDEINPESNELLGKCIEVINNINEEGLKKLQDIDNLENFVRQFNNYLIAIEKNKLKDLIGPWNLIQELASVLGLMKRQ